jgi:hypothetical protein
MAIKQFEVNRYQMALGHEMTATWSGQGIKIRGYVTCFGEDHRFIAYFLTENSPVPQPVYLEHNRVGAVFLPFEQMPPFVDMVRNETPVYAYLNSERPEWNSLKTGMEPVGEEES